jgi:hypothetical protein
VGLGPGWSCCCSSCLTLGSSLALQKVTEWFRELKDKYQLENIGTMTASQVRSATGHRAINTLLELSSLALFLEYQRLEPEAGKSWSFRSQAERVRDFTVHCSLWNVLLRGASCSACAVFGCAGPPQHSPRAGTCTSQPGCCGRQDAGPEVCRTHAGGCSLTGEAVFRHGS